MDATLAGHCSATAAAGQLMALRMVVSWGEEIVFHIELTLCIVARPARW